MNEQRTYVGLLDDQYAGMTPIGRVIRDAWVFGLIPETETCAGWSTDRIQELYDRVTDAWSQHGHLVSRMPPELRERHERIYEEALRLARANGWDPELDDEEE
jgi:hypothetical protein